MENDRKCFFDTIAKNNDLIVVKRSGKDYIYATVYNKKEDLFYYVQYNRVGGVSASICYEPSKEYGSGCDILNGLNLNIDNFSNYLCGGRSKGCVASYKVVYCRKDNINKTFKFKEDREQIKKVLSENGIL